MFVKFVSFVIARTGVSDVYKEAEADAEDLIKNGKEKAKNVKSDLSEIIR